MTNTSHCIGAADPTDPPPTDMDGNPRPNPPGSNPDIGAFENARGTPYIPLVEQLVISVSNGNVVLHWPNTGASSYRIYGAAEPFTSGDLLYNVSYTIWEDMNTSTRPSPYFYYVTAVE